MCKTLLPLLLLGISMGFNFVKVAGAAQVSNGDFETGSFSGWTTTGTAWGNGPTDSHPHTTGWKNIWFADTWKQGESQTGTLRSNTFVLAGTIDFWLAGWNHWPSVDSEFDHNYVVLKRSSDDLELDRVWAPNQNAMIAASLDAPAYIDQEVYIKVIDNGTATGFAWLAIDAFRMSDSARASNPDPADRGLAADGSILSWASGAGAVQHDVYLGTDSGSVNNADINDTFGIYRGRQTPNGYDPNGLTEEVTYYWRIDEVDSGESVIQGDVWYFRVAIPERDLYSDTWVATDGLDRTLSGFAKCGEPRNNKTVGLFYLIWHGQSNGPGPYDITNLLAENPTNPAWGPETTFHWWGEPEAGYFLSDDEWVIRRNISMLVDAGVDVLIYDVTNGFTYTDVYMTMCRVMQDMKVLDGIDVPKLCFFTHSSSVIVVQKLYDEFYSQNLYPELWFQWEGKPIILGDLIGHSAEVADFFTFRFSWAWDDGYHKWQFLDFYPQDYGYDERADLAEAVPIVPATHPTSNIGKSYQSGNIPAQPAHDEYGLPVNGTHGEGLHFSQQWERALALDPEFLFVTGWNEWIAQRFLFSNAGVFLGDPTNVGDTYFVDAYNAEYNRDTEPMKYGCTDNYYYQLVDGIRKYKGVRPPQTASEAKTIAIDGDFSDWVDVRPEFRDTKGDTFHRNHDGFGSAGPYTNTTGRNDLLDMKVARDDTYIYFYVKTKTNLTPFTDPAWMLLYINADQNHATGWEGYDYVVNRTVNSTTSTTLQSGFDGDLNSDLEAWWKLDESSGIIATDGTVKANHGTLTNGPLWHQSYGRLDGAMNLDGVDDYVALPSVLNPATTSFSVAARVRLHIKLGNSSQIICQQEGAGGRSLLYRRVSTDQLGTFIGGTATYSSTSVFATTDQWHHVCVTYDGATVKLYINGVEDASNTVTAEPETSGFRLGSHKTPSADTANWDGWMDEVRMYTRALKASEVLMLAGGVTATDGSTNMVNSDITYQISGNEMELRIPRADIGQGSGNDPVAFDFHWADNPKNPYYIVEFAVSGDSAPNRRFNYRYDTDTSIRACEQLFNDGLGQPMDLDGDCDLDLDDLSLMVLNWVTLFNWVDFFNLAKEWLTEYLPANITADILLNDDFESGAGNWTGWSLVTTDAFSPTHAMECRDCASNLTSVDLDTSGAGSVVIRFRYKMVCEIFFWRVTAIT